MGVKFTNNSIKVKTALKEAGVAWLHEACGEIEAQTKRNSKVLTGKTKGSYQYRVDEDSLEGVVGSDSQNGKNLERVNMQSMVMVERAVGSTKMKGETVTSHMVRKQKDLCSGHTQP